MADHPETTALRLAEAATEACGGTARWSRGKERADGTAQVYAPSYGPLRRVVPVAETTAVFGAHIAHAHPGRVRAWLGAVARLRERAAEGHASDCVRRLGDDATVYRSSDDGDTHHRVRVGDLPCTCGHDLDLAALAAVDAEG